MENNELSADDAAKLIGKKSRQSFYKYYKTERFSADMVVLLKKIGFDVNYIIYTHYKDTIPKNGDSDTIPSTIVAEPSKISLHLITETHHMVKTLYEHQLKEHSQIITTGRKKVESNT